MDLKDQLESALGSSFHIIRELGGGGMSRVFLAEDVEHSREIVVKVVPAELAAQVNVDRFRREIKVAAKLQHPCIVPVLSSGSADGLPYYTMPFVEGESLRARLTRERGLSVQESLRILRDISGAVAYAHEHGIVHRDIKPENILVTKHHAVLADFGVAKALTESTRGNSPLTSVGVALGTPAYMAPEQAAADPSVDHRADIYALGVVAYEMLAGRHPFEGRSSQSMLAAHAIEQPNSVSVHRPSLPASLSGLVTRMMAKHPGDRPQTAEEVLTQIDQVTSSTETAALPNQTTVSKSDKRRKRLILVSGLAGAVVTVVAISMFAFKGDLKTSSIAPANVLVLPAEIHGNDAAVANASDQIVDAVSRGLSQINNLKFVTPAAGAKLDASNAASLGREFGAGTVVVTSIYPAGNQIQLQFRVVDGATGQTIRTLPRVPVSLQLVPAELDAAIDPLLSVVGFITSPALGVRAIPAREPRFAAFKELEAALTLDLAYVNNYTPAREHLVKATELDTGFIQTRLWEMWLLRTTSAVRNQIAFAYRYDTLQKFSISHRTSMTPFEETLAEFVADRGATERGVHALTTLTSWNSTSPMRKDLVAMLADLNRPRAADSVMQSLFEADTAQFSAFWIFRAALNHYMGDYQTALKAARHARQIAPNETAALRAELAALAALGDTSAVYNLLSAAASTQEGSKAFFDFAGDVYFSTAQELVAHGHEAAGRKVMAQTIDWFDHRTPKELENQGIAFRAALVYFAVNRLDDAAPLITRLYRDYPDDFRYMGAMGRLAALRGDTAAALAMERKLASFESEKFLGSPVFERAQIMVQLGRRDDACRLVAEAFAQGVGFGAYRARIHTFTNFVGLRGYPPFDALLTPGG